MKRLISATGTLTNYNNKVVVRNNLATRSHCRGFTLIEILIVVFLIGVLAGIVAIRTGDDASRIASLEAKRFITVVNEVQDLSILSGKAYALAYDPINSSYEFRQNPPDWDLAEEDDLFKVRQFPKILSVDIDIEEIVNNSEEIVNDDSAVSSDLLSAGSLTEDEEGVDITPDRDQVLISPFSGVSPFTLTISVDDTQLQIGLNEEQQLEVKEL